MQFVVCASVFLKTLTVLCFIGIDSTRWGKPILNNINHSKYRLTSARDANVFISSILDLTQGQTKSDLLYSLETELAEEDLVEQVLETMSGKLDTETENREFSDTDLLCVLRQLLRLYTSNNTFVHRFNQLCNKLKSTTEAEPFPYPVLYKLFFMSFDLVDKQCLYYKPGNVLYRGLPREFLVQIGDKIQFLALTSTSTSLRVAHMYGRQSGRPGRYTIFQIVGFPASNAYLPLSGYSSSSKQADLEILLSPKLKYTVRSKKAEANYDMICLQI